MNSPAAGRRSAQLADRAAEQAPERTPAPARRRTTRTITPEFNDLVLRMIQKRPDDRLASLHEFLSRSRGSGSSRTTPTRGGG